MLWWLIPLVLIIISTILIAVVVIRKVPDLRVIDVESIPEERVKKLKQDIIMKRFDRMQSEKLGGLSKGLRKFAGFVFNFGRRVVQKLYALEQYYKRVQKSHGEDTKLDDAQVERMVKEAQKLVREGEIIPAEKKYIEIISHKPKHVPAYEGLGNLYLKNEQYEQARETLGFILRINPEDASVHMSLAEIEMALDNYRKAVKFLRQAIGKRPKNPKYLDAYIESSLNAEMPEDAEKGIELMEEVNPENTKLDDWKNRLGEIKKAADDKIVEKKQREKKAKVAREE